jgi:competence protein ComEC
VLRLVFGSVAVLLAGDIEQPAEDELVRSGVDLRANVVKVPHHGSRTSSTTAFVDAVRPTFAVLSVGERSRFGHPGPEVVQRYIARGARVFQTGRNGTITVETNGRRGSDDVRR